MMKLRPSYERGHVQHGWLESYHTFSFATYSDQRYMGFRALRVINEDYLLAGEGFPLHGHADMEIITYIVEGAVTHHDSLGNTSTIGPGEIQVMSAGRGVRHSELNHYRDRMTHLLQIWILPDQNGETPSYDQRYYLDRLERDGLTLLASPTGEGGSAKIKSDTRLWLGNLAPNRSITRKLDSLRGYWIQLIQGQCVVGDQVAMGPGDGLAITKESSLLLQAIKECEFLLFDLE